MNPEEVLRTERDGTAADWFLPPGTRQLAGLVCGCTDRVWGPILTTNFDPLLRLAIAEAGGQTYPRVMNGDGWLAGNSEVDRNSTQVVYLHGYWRDSDTLHTPAQLSSPRPQLRHSLQNLLRGHKLLVVAYGGWDDIFVHSLLDLLNNNEAKIDVLWCFWDSDPARVQASHEALLRSMQPAVIRQRFRAFGGIDCHDIFGSIAESLGTPVTPPPPSSLFRIRRSDSKDVFVTAAPEIRVGRDPSGDVVIDEPTVSWLHGLIVREHSGYVYYHHSKSSSTILRSNHTTLRLHQESETSTRLQNNDRIEIGGRTLRVSFDFVGSGNPYITTAQEVESDEHA